MSARRVLLVTAAFLCLGLPRAALAQSAADRVQAVLAREAARRAHWGIAAIDVATGAEIYRLNESRLFMPASATKLVVSAAAAHHLPADFRYTTTLLGTGPVENGELRGDLILYGRGDPTISGRYEKTMLSIWEALADSLRARGVRRVSGALIADESYWDTDYVRGDWQSYDLLWWYAAPVGALGFNDNSIDFSVQPGALAEPAVITWQPQTRFFTFVNRTTTIAAGERHTLDFTRVPGTDTIIAYGAIPLGTLRRTEYFAVADPAAYAATVFRETLEQTGITFGSPAVRIVRDAADSRAAAATALVEHRSPPLPQIVGPVLGSSQNWYAEQLLKTLGREVGGEGSWAKGLEIERRFLIDVVGVDSTAFRLRDASGLSVGNLLTPDAFLALLRYIDRSPGQKLVVEALPLSGGTTGSLRTRLQDLQGRVAAKTGSISNVDALAGYVTTGRGRRVAFVILANLTGQPGAAVRPIVDDIVRALAADGAPR